MGEKNFFGVLAGVLITDFGFLVLAPFESSVRLKYSLDNS